MSVPIVKKCCCCVKLSTGTLLIGCLYSLWALLELVGYTLLVTLRPLGNNEHVSMHKYVLYVTAAVVSCLHLLFSVLLVVATVKKLAYMTLPWTIITGIITAVVFMMGLVAMSLVLQDLADIVVEDAVFVAVFLIRAFLSSYCIVVVHSRHKEMMAERHHVDGVRYNPVHTADPTRRFSTICV